MADLVTQLQQLEELVTQAKTMPLSSSALLNRDEVLELLREMRESLPEELKQARWVVKDREELLVKARKDAQAIVDKARAEQHQMAQQEDVVKRAQEEAERLVAEAEREAREIRLEAEDYVDSKLAQFEVVLTKLQENFDRSTAAIMKTLEQVGSGREKLRGITTHPAEEALAPPFDVEQGGEA